MTHQSAPYDDAPAQKESYQSNTYFNQNDSRWVIGPKNPVTGKQMAVYVENKMRTWEETLKHAEELRKNGHKTLHVPNADEAHALREEFVRKAGMNDKTQFILTDARPPHSAYWVADPFTPHDKDNRSVMFISSGLTGCFNKESRAYTVYVKDLDEPAPTLG